MAGRNYYVLSILCTDQFWTGNERSPLGDLNSAVQYSSYEAATNAAQTFLDASRAFNIEIRQMVKAA